MGSDYCGDDPVRLDSVRLTGCCGLTFALSALLACSQPPEPATTLSTYSRVVTLAPNLTELMFAAGAGDALVGVSAYSDFPPAVRELPIIGDAFSVDQEQLALLDPDALFAWQSGTPARIVDELRRIGYHVEVLRTRSLDDVAAALIRIGELTGHEQEASRAAADYVDGLKALELRFAREPLLRVFYQVSQRPLYTINGSHFVSELIELCGGRNIFDDLNELAPAIAVEAVIERDPEVMLASDEAGNEAFSEWDRWPNIAANRMRNRFLMPADEIGRATPRLLIAGESLCRALQQARVSRKSALDTAR
ncbi:MAG: cobalamin-binding protein [Proteobacteria bacterium]|nr:cobalamin-binding protein [Pseudomonadota bacterium]